MKIIPFLFTLCLLALPGPAYAQILDSYYFMADDGVQDQEEKEEEAMFVYDSCISRSFIRSYFDCECVSGTFLQMREELGGIVPQEEIKRRIFREGEGKCGNAVEMAGEMYQICQGYAAMFREYEPDNEDFCECAAKTYANRFKERPFLRTKYIEHLQTRALVDCENRDAQNRPVRQSN